MSGQAKIIHPGELLVRKWRTKLSGEERCIYCGRKGGVDVWPFFDPMQDGFVIGVVCGPTDDAGCKELRRRRIRLMDGGAQ